LLYIGTRGAKNLLTLFVFNGKYTVLDRALTTRPKFIANGPGATLST